MRDITEKDVLETIQRALDLKEADSLTLDSSIGNVEGWDSLGHIGILAALDELFEGKIADIKEIATADSIRKILQVLKDNSLI